PASTLFRHLDADLILTAKVIAYQLQRQVSPQWGRKAPTVAYYPDQDNVPTGAYQIIFYDTSDVEGAAGYHDEDGLPYGKVFGDVSFDYGSTIMTGDFPVCRTACHEAIELFCNPDVNLWVDKYDGTETPHELCDAVEDDNLLVTVGSHVCPGSNFVLPSWFDSQAQPGSRFAFMPTIDAPFAMSENGYQTLRSYDDNSYTQIFGAKYAKHKKAMKMKEDSRARSNLLRRGSREMRKHIIVDPAPKTPATPAPTSTPAT